MIQLCRYVAFMSICDLEFPSNVVYTMGTFTCTIGSRTKEYKQRHERNPVQWLTQVYFSNVFDGENISVTSPSISLFFTLVALLSII